MSDICDNCGMSSEAGETRYLDLGDGRKLCSSCSSIAVMNQEDCNALIEKVLEFYRSLNLKVDENTSIVLVDNNQMIILCKGRDGIRVVGLFIPSIAVCISKVSAYSLPVQICAILVRFILPAILTTTKYSISGGNIKEAVKLLGDVVLILFGKPENKFLCKKWGRISVLGYCYAGLYLINVEMGGALAHEMMHAWLHLQGRPWEWERSVEEGICQVMKHKWMEWFCSSTDFDSWYKTNEQAQYARKRKEFSAQEIECWKDQVYGQGFRDVMCAIERFGFQATLDHTLKNGALPVVPPSVTLSTTTTTIPSTIPSELRRKKATSTPRTELLWKVTSSTKSLWKATAATVTALLWKATTTFETPQFIVREGHCQHHHQGKSHKNIHGGLPASPAFLLVFIGVLIEHK